MKHVFRTKTGLVASVGYCLFMDTFHAEVYHADEHGRPIRDHPEHIDGVLVRVGEQHEQIHKIDYLERRLRPHVPVIPQDIRWHLEGIEHSLLQRTPSGS